MKEKRKAMYGTLEFISNVPYYGIFIINPGRVRLCLFPLFSCWLFAVVSIKLFVPPPMASMPPRFNSLLYWSPAEKHATKVYLTPIQEPRPSTHVRKLLLNLYRVLAVF
jgi:hypothetical protein